MSTTVIVLLVILIILVAVVIGLYFFGKRAEKKRDEQKAQIQAAKQPVTMLVIDKNRIRIKDSGLPEQIISQTPWYSRRAKLPIVKAKIGPQILNLVADEEIYDLIPVKKQIKAMISGIYIVEVRGMRGSLERPKKKKGFWARMRTRANSMNTKN